MRDQMDYNASALKGTSETKPGHANKSKYARAIQFSWMETASAILDSS